MAGSRDPHNNPFYQAVLVDGGAENYDRWAKDYDADLKSMNYTAPQSVNTKWKSYHAQLLARSEDEAGSNSSPKPHRLFDAGCGTGMVGEDLVTFVPSGLIEIYGGDISPESVEIAKTKKVYTDLKVVNLKEELPYEAGSFDSIVCVGTFLQGHCGPECVPNLVRVLKRGCYLIATIRRIFYEETKAEWDKQISECNCKLLEDGEMPYHGDAKAVVIVVQKQ